MFLKADAKNSEAKAYRLKLSGVPTPMDPATGYTLPTFIIPTAAATMAVSKRTAPGFMNISYAGFGSDSKKTYVEWQSPVVKA